jgi:hypothetical protein
VTEAEPGIMKRRKKDFNSLTKLKVTTTHLLPNNMADPDTYPTPL